MSLPGQGEGASPRLASLDAYRGFVMLAMASGGLGIGAVASMMPWSIGWRMLDSQFEHVDWRGCSFWDLIQPSFLFIVGAAMPFSYASRVARGQSWGRMFGHALVRSAILVALGVFLASHGSPRTNFVFTNVLAQIGLGYPFVFLLLRARPWGQALAALLILVGYWALFAFVPFEPSKAPLVLNAMYNDREWLEGFPAHWIKHQNIAAAFDRWFLNLFPRPDGQPYQINTGGYATLNFVPSIATMLFGVLAGELLRSNRSGTAKIQTLILLGSLGLVIGLALDPWACPLVKRIWTPSWTLYSAGWASWLLATFYGLIELRGWRRWSFPLVVAGSNSIALYLMAQLMKPFVRDSLRTHLGAAAYEAPLGPTYAPLFESAAVLMVLWLVVLGMYRQRIFLRI